MPTGKLVHVGAWEDDRFIGTVIFGRGATPNIGRPWGLDQTEVCELVRVALDTHVAPTSRIVAGALRMLHRHCPGIRLVVSFADEGVGHLGVLYQAGNWLYLGGEPTHAYRVRGRIVHPRSLGAKYGLGGQSVEWLRQHVDPRAQRVVTGLKHKYVFPFDRRLRRALVAQARPYPRERGDAETRRPTRSERGGSNPTRSLDPVAA